MYVGDKAFDFSSKEKDFLPKNDQIWPKIGIFGSFGPGHAGFSGAQLVGQLVVVARGLYLARHLFTLYKLISNATTYVRKRFSVFKLDFHLFLFVVWIYGCYSQISIAEAGFCFSQEVIMDIVSTDVVTGICVALADHLEIKQLQLEYQGPLKVGL